MPGNRAVFGDTGRDARLHHNAGKPRAASWRQSLHRFAVEIEKKRDHPVRRGTLWFSCLDLKTYAAVHHPTACFEQMYEIEPTNGK
jgi:hypothetical protein